MGFDPLVPRQSRGYLEKERKRLERGTQQYPHHQGGGPPHGTEDAKHGYSHGFGHAAHKRSGYLRLSGIKGAHRLGKRGS